MEMTKMLLPAVPVATKINSNDEYLNYFYDRDLDLDLDLRKCFLLKLKELKLTEQQRFIEYTETVRQQANQLKNNLLSYESKSRDCVKQRNAHPSEISNEGVRNNNAVRTIAEKKKEIKLLPIQTKPESLLESKPKPESERKLTPQLKVKQEIKLELKPRSEPELESEPGVSEWKRELRKQTESKQNQELESDRDSEIDYMETCSDFMSRLEDSDSEYDSITKMNFDAKQLKAYANKRRKRVKKKFFKSNKFGHDMLYRRTQFCQNLENKNKKSYLQNDNMQMLNMANRSLLKSQHNVNITPLCTLGANNFHQSSSNNQKQLCNQDHQEKNISQQILMNEENVDIMQLLKDDGLPNIAIDTEEELSFVHDQINVSEKFSECMIRDASTMMPRFSDNNNVTQRAKTEENRRQVMEAIRKNTLSDHCYHLNEPKIQDSDLSETDDEEIDVVSCEKKATCSNFAQPQRRTSRAKPAAKVPNNVPVVRRPRGRPPGSAKRKVQNQAEPGLAPKRSRVQNNQQSTARRNQNFVDRQMHNDRRNLHNNMERKRRVELKEFLEMLKNCVPEIADLEKASKVCILQKAKKYIKSLQRQSKRSTSEMDRLQKKQAMLKNKLQDATKKFNSNKDNKKVETTKVETTKK